MIGLPKIVQDRIERDGKPKIEECYHCGTQFMPFDMLGRDRTSCPCCHKADWKHSSTPFDLSVFDRNLVEGS